MSGAVPPPAARPLRRAARVMRPLPWFPGAVGAGVGTRQCGPCGLHPQGGWPSTVVRGVWCQALPLPRPPVPWGGQPGLCSPCFPGAVVVGVGTQHQPHSVRSWEPSLRAVGMAGGRPRGGCPLRGASEFRRSPSPGRPSSGRAVGVRYPPAVGAGVRVWRRSTVPSACMPCGGLRAAGVVGGRPGGGGLPPFGGASGVRRCPSPGPPSFWVCSRDGTTRVSRARLVWAWGASTSPTARALASRHGPLWGWREGVPGGGCLSPL